MAGLHRHEDLPGALVPERYFAYLRGGDARLLAAIGRHNREDVVTMGRLLQVLARELSAGRDAAGGPPRRRRGHGPPAASAWPSR